MALLTVGTTSVDTLPTADLQLLKPQLGRKRSHDFRSFYALDRPGVPKLVRICATGIHYREAWRLGRTPKIFFAKASVVYCYSTQQIRQQTWFLEIPSTIS